MNPVPPAPAKFVQIAVADRGLYALDEDGQIWLYEQGYGGDDSGMTEVPARWFPLSTRRWR